MPRLGIQNAFEIGSAIGGVNSPAFGSNQGIKGVLEQANKLGLVRAQASEQGRQARITDQAALDANPLDRFNAADYNPLDVNNQISLGGKKFIKKPKINTDGTVAGFTYEGVPEETISGNITVGQDVSNTAKLRGGIAPPPLTDPRSPDPTIADTATLEDIEAELQRRLQLGI